MKCPHCTDVTLVMAERQGVEIDYCPQCRGVWLDRGELDKLIDRAAGQGAPTPAQPQPQPHPQQQQPYPPQPQPHPQQQQPYPPQRRPDFQDSDGGYGHQQPYRKRKSWLSDIFD